MSELTASLRLRTIVDRSFGKAVRQQRGAVRDLSGAALKSAKGQKKAVGESVRAVRGATDATKGLGRATVRLGRQADNLGRRTRRTAAALRQQGKAARGAAADFARLQATQGKVSGGLSGGLVGGLGAGLGLSKVAADTLAFRSAGTRLRTVLNAPDRGQALQAANQSARGFARDGLSSETDSLNVQYALNSAGLSAEAARLGSGVVLKVAKVTHGEAERVGEVVATAYNNLGQSLAGTTAQKLQRIGDLLTKTQLKFQIRNFDQLGESVSEAAASIAGSKVRMEEALTLLGVLNNAGLSGSRAGTAFNALDRQWVKARDELGFDLVRDDEGFFDVTATLSNLKEALSGFEDIDERNAQLQTIFGDESKKALIPLLEALPSLAGIRAEVSDGSRGIVGREYEVFQQDEAEKFKRLGRNLSMIGGSLVGAFLPLVNRVLDPLNAGLSRLGQTLDAAPKWVSALAGVGTALGAIAAGAVATRAVVGIGKGLLRGRGPALGQMLGKGRGTVPVYVTNLGSAGGLMDKQGRRSSGRGGLLARGSKLLGRAALPLALGLSALDIGQGLAQGDSQQVGGGVGSLGGALAGGAAGAALGSVVPVIGTAIGGAIGAALGAWGGEGLGEKIGALLEPAKSPAPATVPETPQAPAPVFQIKIVQSPGQSAQELVDEIRRQAGALHDGVVF